MSPGHSTFVAPEAIENGRRSIAVGRQIERRRKFVQIPAGRLDVTPSPELLQGASSRCRGEQGHRPAAIGHLDDFAAGNEP
jgi:hypothetical protein